MQCATLAANSALFPYPFPGPAELTVLPIASTVTVTITTTDSPPPLDMAGNVPCPVSFSSRPRNDPDSQSTHPALRDCIPAVVFPEAPT